MRRSRIWLIFLFSLLQCSHGDKLLCTVAQKDELDFEDKAQCPVNSDWDQGNYKCVCKGGHSTVMSKNGAEFGCFTAKEIGCDEKVDGSEQVYMLSSKKPYTDIQVQTSITTTHHVNIRNVEIWNLKSEGSKTGSWSEIKSEGLTAFQVDNSNDEKRINISGDQRGSWVGKVVRVYLEENNEISSSTDEQMCLIFKVEGLNEYPFNLTSWKDTIKKPKKPTLPPATTTTSETITTKTTTTSKTVTTKTETTSNTTKTTTTTTKTTTTRSTTLTPTTSTNYTLAYILIPLSIVLFVLLIVYFVKVNQRRKTKVQAEATVADDNI